MRSDLPFVGSTREKLLTAGLAHFSREDYTRVDVDAVAADAGVTVGSLYHHFTSKLAFYGVLRDEMARRLLDRMEAAAEAVQPDAALRAAVLAAYDGALRLKIGRLLTDPDPRAVDDPIAVFLGTLATQKPTGTALVGHLLAAAIRAAVSQAGKTADQHARARAALEQLVSPS